MSSGVVPLVGGGSQAQDAEALGLSCDAPFRLSGGYRLQISTRLADYAAMNTEELVCDCCGEPLTDDVVVVIVDADGSEFKRHSDCQMRELLERA